MAKIPTSRLNTAPENYNKIDFDQLIEDLQDIIKILNSTFQEDQSNEEERKTWFLGGEMANIFKNEMFSLANTGANLIYTTPSDSRALIKSVQITNSGANTLVTLTSNNLTNSFNTAIEEISSNTHSNLVDAPLVLQESQTLSITANVANTVSGVLSVLEINRNE